MEGGVAIHLHSILQRFIAEEAKGMNMETLDTTAALLQTALETCKRLKEERTVPHGGEVQGGSLHCETGVKLRAIEAESPTLGRLAVETDKDKPTSAGPTHIDDLPDACLSKIFSLVGNPMIPIERPAYQDVEVSHPLQCALVCKRWRLCAPAGVHSLQLGNCAMEDDVADRVQGFTALSTLSLTSDNREVGALPELARATPNLEVLELDWTFRCAAHVSEALCSWTKLKKLLITGTLMNWYGDMTEMILDVLPKMTSIEHLALQSEGLEAVYEKVRPHMKNLKSLSTRCTKAPPPSMAAIPFLNLVLTELPTHLLRFTNIVSLHLAYYDGDALPHELGSLTKLESLIIEHSHSLTTLPSSLGRLSVLKRLMVGMNLRITHLPASIGNLSALRSFHVTQCEALQTLPDSFSRLTSLLELHVVDMPRLKSLPKALGEMRSLKNLEVSGYERTEWGVVQGALEEIPESLGQLGCLTRLAVQHVPLLVTFPNSLGSLSSLQAMHVVDMHTLAKLPTSIGQLRRLEYLDLVRCDKIISLPQTLAQLTALTGFRMSCCDGILLLPEAMTTLPKLRKLHMEACARLIRLPTDLTNLTSLRELVVRNCARFSLGMEVMPVMSSLRFLWLAGCPRQFCLPSGLEKLTALQLIRCSPGMIERAPEGLSITTEEVSEADDTDVESDDWTEDDEEDGEDEDDEEDGEEEDDEEAGEEEDDEDGEEEDDEEDCEDEDDEEDGEDEDDED